MIGKLNKTINILTEKEYIVRRNLYFTLYLLNICDSSWYREIIINMQDRLPRYERRSGIIS